MAKLPPMHPGEVLREEFLTPFELSANKLAARCRVPRTRIELIAAEETGITADTARFLSCATDAKPFPWQDWPDTGGR